jgi:hypothetical protein
VQLTNEQEALARQELLEMLAANPNGLRTDQLLETRTFRGQQILTAKQVFQLLSGLDGVRGGVVEWTASGDWIPRPERPSRLDSGWGWAILWKLKTVVALSEKNMP